MSRKSKMTEEQVKEFIMDRDVGGQTLQWCSTKYGLTMGRLSQIQSKYRQMELPLERKTESTDPNE